MENNTKLELKERGCEDDDWIQLLENRVQCELLFAQ